MNNNETREEYLKRIYEEELRLFPQMPTFSEEEKAYRRGFCHGFLAAKRTKVTEKEVYEWRHGSECTAPPGSCCAGEEVNCFSTKR